MSEITFPTQVVINRCFGGFGLSDEVSLELAELKGVVLEKHGGYLMTKEGKSITDIVPRNDPDLVALVLLHKEKANGKCAKLDVVDILVHVEIGDYDGKERLNHAYVEYV